MAIYTKDEVSGVLDQFAKNYDENIASLSQGTLAEHFDKGADAVKDLFKAFNDQAILSIPEGVSGIQKVNPLVSLLGTGEEVEYVSLVLRTSRTLKNQLHETFRMSGGTPVADVTNMYKSFYSMVILETFLQENLLELNAKMEHALEEAGVSYSVSFASPLEATKASVIKFISNDEIEFIVTEKDLLSLNDFWLFNDNEELQSVAENAQEALVDSFAEFSRPIDLILGKHPFVMSLVETSHKKPKTLVKESLSRTVDGITHFKKDVDAYYEKDGVVAVVRREDGQFHTLFGPVDADTFEAVDVDVVGNLS